MEKPEWLSDSIGNQLEFKWRQYRDLKANSKGYQYEVALQKLLKSYFGHLYDIHVRAATIDPKGRSFECFNFNSGNEELDVVSTFKQSNPNVVLKKGDNENSLTWVPFEAIAFVCEVKSQLDTQSIKSDLEKLERVRKVGDGVNNRFGPNVGNKFTIQEPLRCLVYDTASIENEKLEMHLSKNKKDWHILLVAQEDICIINESLPVSGLFHPFGSNFGPDMSFGNLPSSIINLFEKESSLSEEFSMITLKDGFVWFLVSLSLTIPSPISVSTVNSIISLFATYSFEEGAKTDLN